MVMPRSRSSGSLIDGRIVGVLSVAEESQILGDGSGQRGLAMVDVADGADVDMGLILNKMSALPFGLSSLVDSLTVLFLHPLHHTRHLPI